MSSEIEDPAVYSSLKDFHSKTDNYFLVDYQKEFSSASNPSKRQLPSTERYSLWSIVMKQCRIFCETTSLRGVPRIAKSNEPKRKVLWTFFVTIFFLACITSITLLVIQYRQYDVIHQPKTVYNQPRPFPSLTMCNLRPLSSHSIKILKNSGLISVTEYLKRLKHAMVNLRQLVTKIERKLLTMSWNINSYFLNLPNSTTPSDLGHHRLEMIMTCVLVYKEGIYTSGIQCDNAGHWVLTLNSIFLNCHTFIVSEQYSNRTFNMELVLYLDNSDEMHCHDCQERLIVSQLTGIRLNLHSSGTYPEINEKGINLMPGTLTEIKFIPREWKMMEPPHGKCSRKVSKRISFNEAEFEYSEEACKKKVLQEQLAKKCDCVDFNQIPDELYHYLIAKKMCKFLSFSLFSNDSLMYFNRSQMEDYLTKTFCELEESSKINYQLSKCSSPCTFHTYDTTISSAEWPTKSYHAAFLISISDIIEKRLNVNPNIAQSTKIAWKTIIDKLRPYVESVKNVNQSANASNGHLLNNLKFVSKNFLSIQIGRQNFDFILVEEKATVSLTNFLSQAGGIFSIWSGITFFCIVEMLELFIIIVDELKLKNYRH